MNDTRKRLPRSVFQQTASIYLVLAAGAPAIAEVSGPVRIDIAAQPLRDALDEISEAYDVPIISTGAVSKELQAPRVAGALTTDEAVDRILDTSGLEAKRSSSGAILVVQGANRTQSIAGGQTSTASEAEKVRVVEEIVVKGTKRGRSLQETIESVSVFSAEDFDDQALYELNDVYLRAPNVTGGIADISVRGIGSNGVGFTGTGRTINLYLDGAPASSGPAAGGNNTLWDVEQVEVLLGPQATAQGRNALAGAVVQWTADPQYELGAKLRVLAGSDETFQGSAMVTGPILDGQVAYRLTYDHREEDFDGFNPLSQRPIAYGDFSTIRGKLLIEPDAIPDLRVELNVNHLDSFRAQSGRVILPPADSPERETFDPYDFISFDFRSPEASSQSTYYIADVTYQLNDNWHIATITTYEDAEGGIENFGSFSGLRETDAQTTAFDFRLHFDYERLEGWLGAYYFKEESAQLDSTLVDLATFPFPFEPAGSVISRNSKNDFEIDNRAIYGDLTYRLTDRLSIGVGARYDEEERFDTGFQGSVSVNNPSCVIDLGSGPQPCGSIFQATSDPALDVDYQAFLPRADVSYELNKSSSLSFAVARGYRAGGVQTVGDENVEFDPEFLTNYEMVYRSLWIEDKLTFNVNVFFSDWTDQQLAIPDGLNSRTVNLGKSEMFGAEFYTSYQFDNGLNVYGTLGLLDTEITNAPFAIDEAGNALPGEPGFANLAGNEFRRAPSMTATLGGSYRHRSGLAASMNLSYRDETYTDLENLEINRSDSFWLLNARLGYRWSTIRASVFATNLLDEEAFTFRTFDVVTTVGGIVQIAPAPLPSVNFLRPRQFGVELEYTY